MNPPLVDFHCHLDLFPDIESAVMEAEKAGVYTLAVTTTPKAWPRNFEITRTTRHVRAALGFHPQLVAERHNEVTLWENYLPQAHFIGEVGLEASPRYFRSFELQKQVFERILRRCAESGAKILSVHSVRAAKPVLDLIEKHFPPPRGRVVLHWFTGSKAEARRGVELGCYFSTNAEMIQKERGREMIASLPVDRLLTETDGPFTKIDGRPTLPEDVISVVVGVAKVRGVTLEDMANTIEKNLRNLLNAVGTPPLDWESSVE